jgi:hypothetical protein
MAKYRGDLPRLLLVDLVAISRINSRVPAKPSSSSRGKEFGTLDSNTKQHPAWDVYGEFRTAHLNVRCLECVIKTLRRRSNVIEAIIAVAGTSSIGGFWFLQNNWGTLIWKILGATAVIIGALKPLSNLTEKRMKKERLAAGYRILAHELQCICVGIKDRRAYDQIARDEFRIALQSKKQLIGQSDEEPCTDRIRKKCRISINQELPVEEFYIPD